MKFSENDANFGSIRGDGTLYGSIKSVNEPLNPNDISIIVDNVTSNTTSDCTTAPSPGIILIIDTGVS